jgi:hypothetical protein
MKLPTVKYPSGLEVSLAAWLLKMASLDVAQARRLTMTRERSGVKDTETPVINHQKEERNERRSFQR